MLRDFIRPIARWRLFKIQWQVLTQGNSAGRVTDKHYQRLYSHTSNTCTQQFSAYGSIYGKASTHEDNVIVKMASSSESSSEDETLVLFCCWC